MVSAEWSAEDVPPQRGGVRERVAPLNWRRTMNVKIKTGLAAVLAISMAMADGLPEGYTSLPFLKASGQCQVKTGVTPASTDKVELTFELSTVSGNQNLWCSRNDATNSFTAFMIADKVRLDRNTTQVSSSAGLTVAKKYILEADYAAGTGTVTDLGTDTIVASIAGLGTADYDPERELCLFASNTTDTDTGLNNYGSWTFYSFKLRDADGNLRCDLVPARRTEDGVLGLYDVARDTFLVNGLAGTLTLGEGYSFAEDGTVLVAVTATTEGGGTVRIGDGEATASATANINQDGSETVTLTAVPDEGCKFFGWTVGENLTLTEGDLKSPTITVSATKPGSVKALFYAPSDVCAKLVGSTFVFYKDATCSPESELSPEDSPSSIAGCTVLFANDAEYQALVPFTNELATAKGGVAQMQGNITLTDDTDWRVMDFNMNGKTVTLRGWDLQVRKPQGTGRFTSGNLLDPNAYSYTSGSSADASWIYLGSGSSSAGVASRLSAKQTFTLPKSRTCYFKTQTKRLNSNWGQYPSVGITSTADLMPKTANLSGTQTQGPFVRTGLTSGTSYTIKYYWNNGKCYIGKNATFSPTSFLYFDIPDGEEYDTANITLGGSTPGTSDFGGLGLQIHKTGKGKLTMSKVNSDFGVNGNKNVTSLVVEDGVVAKGAGATCGVQYSRIEVMDGAQFDINGRTYHDYDYTIAGTGPDGTGALISSAELDAATAYAQNTSAAFLRHVTLSGDATIYAGGNMGLIFYNYSANTMTMGGHTVTYDGIEEVDEEDNGTGVGAYTTFLGNMSYSGEGKIVVATNGWVQGHIANVSAGQCDVEVAGRYWQNTGTITNMNSLTFLAGSRFRELNASPATITVYSSYAPNEISESAEGYRKYPTVQLGDADHLATTLDLSHLTKPFDDSEEGTLVIYSADSATATGKHVVTVEIGDRTEGFGYGYLYKWKTPPENVEFVRSARMEKRKISLERRADGLAVAKGTILIIR